MKIKVTGTNGKPILITADLNNPWNEFIRTFYLNGIEICDKTSSGKFDYLISNSHRWKDILRCKVNQVSKENRILILWEPKTNNQKVFRKIVLNRYGKIYSPSPEWIVGKNVSYFNWPQRPFRENNFGFTQWQTRKNKAIVIAANKFSIYSGELYSLRRELLRDKKSIDYLDIAGPGWNENWLLIYFRIVKKLINNSHRQISFKSIRFPNPNVNNYLGIVTDKNSLSQGYKFAIVIENSADYVSEKLFDALDAENIVIYVGANLEKFNLSKDLAIQVAPVSAEIYSELSKLLTMSTSDLRKILENQQKLYFGTKNDWNNKIVLSNLAEQIVKVDFSTISPIH